MVVCVNICPVVDEQPFALKSAGLPMTLTRRSCRENERTHGWMDIPRLILQLPFSCSGTVTNTCPARRTSTGRPGRHGNAATCLAAAASSRAGEPARMATTVPGVAR